MESDRPHSNPTSDMDKLSDFGMQHWTFLCLSMPMWEIHIMATLWNYCGISRSLHRNLLAPPVGHEKSLREYWSVLPFFLAPSFQT